MKQRDQSPIDGIADEPIPTSLPLAAVEAMCKSYAMQSLMATRNPRDTLSNYAKWHKIPPDWMIAGLNCQKDEDILPICIHSYLMSWESPQ